MSRFVLSAGSGYSINASKHSIILEIDLEDKILNIENLG